MSTRWSLCAAAGLVGGIASLNQAAAPASPSAAPRGADEWFLSMEESARRGDRTNALACAQAAFAAGKRALGPNHPQVYSNAVRICDACWGLGDYAALRPYAEEALAIALQRPGKPNPDAVTALNCLGRIELYAGNVPQARAQLEQALELSRSASDQYHVRVLPVLGVLSGVCREQGDFRRAEELVLLAVELASKAKNLPDMQHAQTLSDAAQFYVRVRDYDRAERLLQSASRLYVKALPPDDPRHADLLDRLGMVNYRLKAFPEAFACLDRSHALKVQHYGPNHPGVAATAHLLANAWAESGDYRKAVAASEEAVRILELNPRNSAIMLATVLNNHGWFALNLNDPARAEQALRKSLALSEQIHGPQSEDAANVRVSLALALNLQQRPDEALDVLAAATAVYNRLLDNAMLLGGEAQKIGFMEKIEGKTAGTVEAHLRYAPAGARAARLAGETVLRRKGLAVETTGAGLAQLRRRADAPTGQAFARLGALQSRLAHMAIAADKRFDREEARTLFELDRDIYNVTAALYRSYSNATGVAEINIVEEVRRRLPADSVLVEYVVYPAWRPAVPRERWPLRCAAYLLFPDGRLDWADLGDHAPIQAAGVALRQALARPAGKDYEGLARQMEALVFEPVRGKIGARTRVFLAPDGDLSLLPFGALRDAAGVTLLERYQFVYLNSGRDLLALGKRAPRGAPPVAFGAPDYDAESGGPPQNQAPAAPALTGRPLMTFAHLPGTQTEVDEIKAVLPDMQVLTGDRATEGRFKSLRGPSIVHVATHGFFLTDQGALVDGVRGFKQRVEAPVRREAPNPDFQIYQHPMLRAGLALAGANGLRLGTEDGILTALEAAAMDLAGTQLLVLSACETGSGESRPGLGVFGLRRAFAIAGVQTLVMSLWKVDDAATKDLMVAYYGELKAGVGKTEAMRQVQKAMRQQPQRSHPFFWAAFVVCGDWGPYVPESSGTSPRERP